MFAVRFSRSTFIFGLITAVFLTGCAGRISRQATITSTQVPVVAAVSKLGTVDDKKAAALRRDSEEIACVYLKALGSCYWQDNEKVNRVLLIQTGRRHYDLIRVDIVCNASVNQYTVDRNGKPQTLSTVVQPEC